MSVSVKPLILSKYASNVDTAEYTTPSSTNTIIDKFIARNNTGGAVTLTIYLVPNGGSSGNDNLYYSTSIAANTTVDLTEIKGNILATGGAIRVLAGAASSITIRASGREVT